MKPVLPPSMASGAPGPCPDWTEAILAAARATSTGGGTEPALTSHLADCEACRAEYEDWRAIGQGVHQRAAARAAALILPTLNLPGLPPISGQGPQVPGSTAPAGEATGGPGGSSASPIPSSASPPRGPAFGAMNPSRLLTVMTAAMTVLLVLWWALMPQPTAPRLPQSNAPALGNPFGSGSNAPALVRRQHQPMLVQTAVATAARAPVTMNNVRMAAPSAPRAAASSVQEAPAPAAMTFTPPPTAVPATVEGKPVEPPRNTETPEETPTADSTTMPKRRVSGRVSDEGGQGVAEVEVVAEPVDEAAASTVTAITEPGGGYSMNLAIGEWYIYARASGRSPGWRGGSPWSATTLTVDETSLTVDGVDLMLGQAFDSAVRGRVADDAGRGRQGALIVALALGADGRPADPEHPAAMALTNRNGTYVLYAPEGRFWLAAAASWHDRPQTWWSSSPGSGEGEPVEISQGGDGKSYDFTLP